jgi:hypothetical protein
VQEGELVAESRALQFRIAGDVCSRNPCGGCLSTHNFSASEKTATNRSREHQMGEGPTRPVLAFALTGPLPSLTNKKLFM